MVYLQQTAHSHKPSVVTITRLHIMMATSYWQANVTHSPKQALSMAKTILFSLSDVHAFDVTTLQQTHKDLS